MITSETVREIANYELLDRLGQGGMGVVYRALDRRTGCQVALKLLAASADTEANARRFRREFRAAARLRHPHVAAVFDFHSGSPLYYTMELVEGPPLDRYLAGVVTHDRAACVRTLVTQILVGLDAVHQAELIHRDLKPANILIGQAPADLGFEPPRFGEHAYPTLPDGSRPLVKLVDFGLALAGDQSAALTKAGAIVGTAEYISPEQVLGGEVDLRADLYSLGVVVFELLTGQPPFRATDTVSLLLKHAYEVPPSPSQIDRDCDPALSAIVDRLLAKDPADRFSSARDVLAALADPSSVAAPVSLSGIRLAPRPQGLFPSRLVARDEAVHSIRECLSVARHGASGLVVIAGESGIGKSRLVEEAQKTARMLGLSVVNGAAHEEQGYAFAPFLPILDGLAREMKGVEFDRPLIDAARTLGRLVPCWRQLIPDTATEPEAVRPSAEEERYQVFGALFEVLRRVARRHGVLVTIEDLHHADPLSIDLLAYLLRAACAETEPGLALAIVVSLQEEEIEAGSSLARWREGLQRSDAVVEVRPGRLDRDAIEAMARSMLGAETVPAEIVRWLFRESQGVPFVAAELLSSFAGEGQLSRLPGGIEFRRGLSGEFEFPRELPASVQETVRRRLAKLGEEEKKVAAAAAVIGPEVAFDLLAAASGLEEDDLLDRIQVLLARRILVESREDPDRFLFPSKVARDVLVTEQFDRRRRRIHERVAGALLARANRRPEDVVVLGHHFLQAGKKLEALPHLLDAIAFHRSHLHHEEALSAARRALELIDEGIAVERPYPRLMLLRDIGEIEAALCNYERAAAVFADLERSALAAGAVSLEVEAWLGRADIDLRRGDYADAELRVERALELCATRSVGLDGRAHTAHGRIAWHCGRPADALAAFTSALAAAVAETPDPSLEATALNNIGYAHFAMGHYGEAERWFARCIAVARSRENLVAIARNLEARASVAQRLANYASGSEWLGEAKAIMGKLGDRRGEAYCEVSIGNIAAYRGQWLSALEAYGSAEAIFIELGESRGLAFCAANRGRVLTCLGRHRESLEALGEALRLARKIREPAEIASCLFALGELWRGRDEWSEAARHDHQALSILRGLGEPYGLGLSLTGAAETALGLGDREGSRAFAEAALEQCRATGGMPEIEVRAGLIIARLDDCADAAMVAATAATTLGLRDLAGFAWGLAGEIHRSCGAGSCATSCFDRAIALFNDLAATLGESRGEFLARSAVRRAMGRSETRAALTVA